MNSHRHFLVAFSLALAVLLAGCSAHLGPSPKAAVPPSITNPPIYPGAQNIKRERPLNEFGPRITFETTDTLSTVNDYYRNLLLKEGWTPSSVQAPNNLYFSQYDGTAEYRFEAKFEETSLGH